MQTPGNKVRGLRADAAAQSPSQEDVQRARRLDILRRTAGMWKDRTDIPKDGTQFQLAARAEWG